MTGQQISRAVLRDGDVSVAVLSAGAAVQDWRVPLHGRQVPVVLGYTNPQVYRQNRHFVGALVGRVANRVGGAAFTLSGRRHALAANDGPHLLHGGAGGLWAVTWGLEVLDARSLRLTHDSPEGACGFPGAVAFEVTMTLTGTRLTWDMRATPDRETPISLAQHNYYNLSGAGKVGDHLLRLSADRMLGRDAQGVMDGSIRPAGALDFRQPRRLADCAPVDDFLLFDTSRDPLAPVAELIAANGLRLRMWSDQPGAQVYTGQFMPEHDGGPVAMGPGAGLCIEPSGYPNAVNQPGFPSILATPDRPYRQRLSVEIAPA